MLILLAWFVPLILTLLLIFSWFLALMLLFLMFPMVCFWKVLLLSVFRTSEDMFLAVILTYLAHLSVILAALSFFISWFLVGNHLGIVVDFILNLLCLILILLLSVILFGDLLLLPASIAKLGAHGMHLMMVYKPSLRGLSALRGCGDPVTKSPLYIIAPGARFFD